MDPAVRRGGGDAVGSSRAAGRRIAVAFVALVAVVGVAYVALKPDATDTRRTTRRPTVASFHGSGDQTTRAFQVKEGWRIDWTTTGKRFSFAIMGDRDLGTVVTRKEPGSGTTTPIGSGTFRLVIKAKGGWSVRILDPA